MRNIAVILAGGTGTRVGGTLPKQFMQLGGKTVVEHSIDAFCHHAAIDEVAVVVHPDWRARMEELVACNRWEKLGKVIDGGAERHMSSLNAVMAYIDSPDDTNLLLHDAARPWVTAEVIDRVVEALRRHEAVGVGVPSSDTVWEVRPDLEGDLSRGVDNVVARIPERRGMWLAQTPQAFRLPLLRDAYQRAMQDPQFSATDDCGVVRRYIPQAKIAVVEGSVRNKKITYKEDFG